MRNKSPYSQHDRHTTQIHVRDLRSSEIQRLREYEYFHTKCSEFESSFWPFSTISNHDMLPLDGELME